MGTNKPDRRTMHVTKDEYRRAIENAAGLLSVAARSLGVNRRTIYRAMERWPELQDAVDEARDLHLDVAEGKLFAAVQRGEKWAVLFALRTLGKTRGYVERTEVDDLRAADLSNVPTETLRAWLQQPT